jgi:hypothetical protein
MENVEIVGQICNLSIKPIRSQWDANEIAPEGFGAADPVRVDGLNGQITNLAT